jgi:hypothetical protein
VHDQPAIIPSKGPPLFGGAKVLLWGQTYEVGRVDGPIGRTGAVPLRKPGELVPRSYEIRGADLEGELAALEPGRIGPALAWSETLDHQGPKPTRNRLAADSRRGRSTARRHHDPREAYRDSSPDHRDPADAAIRVRRRCGARR